MVGCWHHSRPGGVPTGVTAGCFSGGQGRKKPALHTAPRWGAAASMSDASVQGIPAMKLAIRARNAPERTPGRVVPPRLDRAIVVRMPAVGTSLVRAGSPSETGRNLDRDIEEGADLRPRILFPAQCLDRVEQRHRR